MFRIWGDEYDLIVLRLQNCRLKKMRKLIAGSFHAKHAAMWEGPFKFYVWLDSDAIVWGDFTSQIRTDVDFQIFWSEISIPADATEIPPWLPHFYFDPPKLRDLIPTFDWRGHAYFSAGRIRVPAQCNTFSAIRGSRVVGRQVSGPFRIRPEQLQWRHGNAELSDSLDGDSEENSKQLSRTCNTFRPITG